MTAKEVLKTISDMPGEDLAEIQTGIAELMVHRFSADEVDEIGTALREAEAEFHAGDALSTTEMRRRLGLS